MRLLDWIFIVCLILIVLYLKNPLFKLWLDAMI
ncbi:hypothetical protein GAB14E_4272 [Colwellia psychrerythraea]|uniref:Uncharacterized protein n=1 Tax=Colwellia psychrerythraea TaxID=28229 RepID=A0A099KB27_COLPS|nr:hypothetical protein GAB14E_4272 [Colwellia psychrerythraea]